MIIAAAFDLFFEPFFKADAPLLSFTITVMLVAWYGGFGPGLFATILSGVVSSYLFLHPIYSFHIEHPFDRTRVALFFITGIMTSVICESLHRAKKTSEEEAEQAHESELRFRVLADNNVAGVALAEANGTLTYVNDAFLKIVGYSREDFESGRVRWDKTTSPEWMKINAHIISRANNRGISRSFEEKLIRKDGNRVSVLIASSWTKTEGTDLLVCTVMDITRRKRAEEELRKSNDNYQALITATTQAVWSAGENSRSKGISDWWEGLTGQDLEKLEAWEWLKALHPDDRETAKKAWSYAIETKTVLNVEYRVKTKEGDYQYFAVRGVPIFDDKGSFVQWVGTFSDITKRKSIEQALRESEERLNTVIENLSEGLIIADLEGNLLLWNQAALNLHGFTSHNEQERPLMDFKEIFDLVTLEGRVLSFDEWVMPRIFRGETINNVELKIRGYDQKLRSGSQQLCAQTGGFRSILRSHPPTRHLLAADK